MSEMREEIGVKKRAQKKLLRNTWAGHVKKCQINKWQRELIPEKWRENGSDEHRYCDVDCTKGNIERVGKL